MCFPSFQRDHLSEPLIAKKTPHIIRDMRRNNLPNHKKGKNFFFYVMSLFG